MMDSDVSVRRHSATMKRTWQRHFERLTALGFWRTSSYYLFTVVLEKIGIHFYDSFIYAPAMAKMVPSSSQVTFAVLKSMADLTPADLGALRDYGGQQLCLEFGAAFTRGESCAVARWRGQELACVCWITTVSNYVFAGHQSCRIIQRCFTVPAYRGKELYPMTLGFACEHIAAERCDTSAVFIECSMFNAASTRGIRKAGFVPAGRIITVFGWKGRWHLDGKELRRSQSHTL